MHNEIKQLHFFNLQVNFLAKFHLIKRKKYISNAIAKKIYLFACGFDIYYLNILNSIQIGSSALSCLTLLPL